MSLVLLAGAAPAEAWTQERKERRVARFINEVRHHAGRSWLRRSWPLDELADRHSLSMGQNYRLRPVSCCTHLVGAARRGELWRLLESWRSSRKLRGPWTRMGVGVERQYGLLWVTVVLR